MKTEAFENRAEKKSVMLCRFHQRLILGRFSVDDRRTHIKKNPKQTHQKVCETNENGSVVENSLFRFRFSVVGARAKLSNCNGVYMSHFFKIELNEQRIRKQRYQGCFSLYYLITDPDLCTVKPSDMEVP